MVCFDCVHCKVCSLYKRYNEPCDYYEERKKKGKWIAENSEPGALGIKYTDFKCNQCGWDNSLVIPRNFCPNCGADMRGDV